MRKLFILAGLFVIIFSCAQQNNKFLQHEAFRQQADSLSNLAQNELLKQLSGQIEKNGIPQTIEYCKLNALSILDSTGKAGNMVVSRISDKYRNKKDKPTTDEETIIQAFATSNIKDTVVAHNDKIVYYKRISIGMTTCMKCHGSTEDIATNVQQKIQELYPEDKATGYQMGDFRGLWKIEKL